MNTQVVLQYLENEYKLLNAGKANIEAVKQLKVEAYGSMTPLEQVGTITPIDALTLSVNPWDKSLMQAIQKAIQESNLGINPIVQADHIKLPFPAMTEEKRKQVVKLVKERLEEAKIRLRQMRKESMEALDKKFKDKLISEDVKKSEEKKIQTEVDDINKKLEEMSKSKEESVMKI